jgi:chromate transport protein ChrA
MSQPNAETQVSFLEAFRYWLRLGFISFLVGVILNLALVFGLAVIWPRGFTGGTDWLAATITVGAFIALYRLKLDVLWVVLAGGLIGLARLLPSAMR